MFYHVKELEFDARVSEPDPRFARLLFEQFGGGNGELKAGMQYFCQAFAARKPYPDKYDLLMDIATEEFSHLEIVGATITMLMDGLNGELKNATENVYLTKLTQGNGFKEEMIHSIGMSPESLVLTGGGIKPVNSGGIPWSGNFINSNGDLTVDLRSNIAAESRAKIVYEYLLQFTDDPLVQETIRFLMTREVAHFQQFAAALETIVPNFPPGVLQGDPRYSHVYLNTSQDGRKNIRGPWNQGQGPWPDGEEWEYIADPIQHVKQTKGMTDQAIHGTPHSETDISEMDKTLSQKRSLKVKEAVKKGSGHWSDYEV